MRLSYLFGAAAVVVLGKMLMEKRARRECELCGLDLGFFAEGSSCNRCGLSVCDRCLRFDHHCDRCYEDIDARIATSTSEKIPGYKVIHEKGVATTNRFRTSERALYELKVQADEKGANALIRVKFKYEEPEAVGGDDDGNDEEAEETTPTPSSRRPNVIAQADAVYIERDEK